VCVQNVECLGVNSGGAYSDYWALSV